MKLTLLFVISLITLQMQAQNRPSTPTPPATTPLATPTPPAMPNPASPAKHFHPGQVRLIDSTLLTGYIRDYIHSNASIVFLDPHTGTKRNLTGAQLISVDIDTTRFICLKGDFFRIIAISNQWFLQKSSDASSKPSYNGTEPILTNGTEGRLNDYFLYEPSTHLLQLVNSKTMATVIPTAFFKQR